MNNIFDRSQGTRLRPRHCIQNLAGTGALVFYALLCGPSSALIANDEIQTPPPERDPESKREASVALLAWIGGARYKPASPMQRAKIRRSITNDSAPEFDGALWDSREPISRTDQFQALGFLYDARGGDRIFYDMTVGLALQQGTFRFARETDSASGARSIAGEHDERGADALVFLPGKRSRLGLRFCAELCELSLGRHAPDDAFANELTGGHGSLTGVHLNFVHAEYGAVHFAPLYRPELSGSYLQSGDEDAQAFPTGASEYLRDDFHLVAKQSRSYGHRLAYTGRFAGFWLGLDYAVHRQNDTANPAAAAPAFADSAQSFRRSVDHIQYSGVGLGYRGELLAISTHIQRAVGSYRTLVASPALSSMPSMPSMVSTVSAPAAPTTPGEEPAVVERQGRIAGSALRSRAAIRHANWVFELNFFLPEPAGRREAGAAAGSTDSGYVGFGDTPLASPILRGVLNFRPTPELCHNRGLCEGLAVRNFAADRAAAPGDALEISFRDHAAVLRARFAYRFERFRPELILTIFAPLAPRGAGGRTPFERLKKDRRSFEYREIEIGGLWEFPGAGQIQLRYSRLYRRHPATSSLLAGEHLRFLILYRF
ncbi:MAG: hypothetical protein NXI24_12210 [bacterium]|nr:hypothetical protein [bacterium]